MKVIEILVTLASGKHIQAYSSDPDIEELIGFLKIDGKLTPLDAGEDYLNVLTTSIGGNKSDRFIESDITHHTTISEEGMMTDELTIKKTHTFNPYVDFWRWDRYVNYYGTKKVGLDTLRFILGQGPNKDYMRIYVPKGSTLLNSSISDVVTLEELNYTVFGFYFPEVKYGKTEEVRLEYKLPTPLQNTYQFTAEKQAAVKIEILKKPLNFLKIGKWKLPI